MTPELLRWPLGPTPFWNATYTLLPSRVMASGALSLGPAGKIRTLNEPADDEAVGDVELKAGGADVEEQAIGMTKAAVPTAAVTMRRQQYWVAYGGRVSSSLSTSGTAAHDYTPSWEPAVG
jgi:hypothetical protein